MSFNWWVDKLWYIHTIDTTFSNKTEGTADTVNNMDEHSNVRIALNERNKTQNAEYCRIPFI